MGRRGKPVAFTFYFPDWLSDLKVRRLTPSQRGVYIDLLCVCAQEDGLPDKDAATYARFLGCDVQDVEHVLDAFFTEEVEDRWWQPKLLATMEERASFVARQSALGRIGAARRDGNRDVLIEVARSTDDEEVVRAAKTALEALGNGLEGGLEGGHDGSLVVARSSSSPSPSPSPSPRSNNVSDSSNPPAHKPRAGARGSKRREPIPLPQRIDAPEVRKVWDEFLQMRKEMRGAFTPTAERRALVKLDRLSDGDSNRAYAVVLQSIENGWKGLFEVKDATTWKRRGRMSPRDIVNAGRKQR